MKSLRRLAVGMALVVAAVAAGCALPAGRLPRDQPMPSGGARWVSGSMTPYAKFAAVNWAYGRFTPDDRLQWSRLANPTDEVWRWTSLTGQAGYALVRNGRVLTVAVTEWGLHGN